MIGSDLRVTLMCPMQAAGVSGGKLAVTGIPRRTCVVRWARHLYFQVIKLVFSTVFPILRQSLFNPGYPRTYYVAQAGL